MSAQRNSNNSFTDKLLAIFGFRRPKNARASKGSVRGTNRSNENAVNNLVFDIDEREDYYSRTPKNTQNSRRRKPVQNRVPRKNKENYFLTAKRQFNERKNASNAPIIGDNFEIIQPKNDMKKKKKDRKISRSIGRTILAFFLIGVISFCLIVGSFMIYVFAFVDGKVDQDLDNLKLDYTSILYAKDPKSGNDIELTRLHGAENRLWIDLKDMPKFVEHAFISAEDKRFDSHAGVDWKRTFSAFANLIFKFYDTQQGGSTITQQLVKNITDDKETSAMRKVREIMRARYLEGEYSKPVIIECYLNTIHLGNGVDGVEVAANYYFDKHASDLNLVQAACLAAVTKSPSGYDPYKNPEENKNRRNWVLSEMHNNGYITKEQYEEAKEADLGLRDKPSTVLSTTKTVDEKYNSYFVDTVIEDVIKGLMEKENYSYEYAESMLYKGGYKIYTTVDLNIQKTLESVFKDNDNFLKVRTPNNRTPQAAMTIMDYNGHVVGIVGGRGEKKGNRVLNRATQSPRQPGSSIKPITCYAPALEYNIITYASKMVDGPISRLENGQKVSKWPRNYSGGYSGNVSVLYALEQSLNTIPVKLTQEMGLRKSFDFATKRLGLNSLVESATVNGQVLSDIGESALALGGGVYGATTRELTASYAAFGNLGNYWRPTTFTKVLNQKNEVVLKQDENPKIAMSPDTANVMSEMLQRVTTNGTGKPAAFNGWPIMSKTGTTTDTKDRWFVGGTPYYIAAVWFGIDESEPMSGLWTNPALKLWSAAMRPIHKDLKKKDFPQSDAAEYRKYCTISGKAATSGCTSTAYGWFKGSYHPTCDMHYGTPLKPATKPKPVGEPVPTSKQTGTTTVATTKAPNSSDTTKTPDTSQKTETSTAPDTTVATTTASTTKPQTTIPVVATTATTTKKAG